MSRAGWSSPTPPKRHANGATKPPNVFHPRHTKAALAARLGGAGEGTRETHQGGAGVGIAASVAKRGDVGNVFG